MTCRELIDFLDDYLAEALAPEARHAFDKHLSVCLDCANYLESYKRTVRLGKVALADTDGLVPADVPEGLINAILGSGGVARSKSPE